MTCTIFFILNRDVATCILVYCGGMEAWMSQSFTPRNQLQYNIDIDCGNLFLKPHSMVAGIWLTYPNFRQIKGISPALHSVP